MKIESLVIENVTGRDFSLSFAPVNVIVGDNGKGKTSVLNAVKVALRGYLPRLGKQHKATGKLAGSTRPKMFIHLGLGGESKIEREWSLKPSGGWNYTEKVEGITEVPSEALDMVEFFQMTGPEQTKFLSSKVDLKDTSFSDEQLLEFFGKIEALPIAHCQPAVEELLKLANTSIIRRKTTKQSLQEWLIDLGDKLKSEKKFADESAKRMAGTQGAYRTEGPAPKSVADQVAVKTKERDAAAAKLNALLADKQKFDNQKVLREKLTAKAAEPIPDTEAIESQIEQVQKMGRDLEALRALHANHLTTKKGLQDQLNEVLALRRSLEADPEPCPTCHPKRLAEATAREERILEAIANADTAGKATKEKGVAAKAEFEKLPNLKFLEQNLKQALLQKNEVEKAKAELATLQTALPEPDLSGQPELQSQIDALNVELAELQSQEDAFKDYESKKANAQRTEGEQIGHQVKATVFKKAVDYVLEKQETVVSEAISSLLGPAREVTDGLLPGKLDFRDGELGMDTDHGWASYQTFSGRDQAIGFAGFSLALSRQSPIKVVIVDELGWLDDKVKPLFIKRMIAMVESGVIDFFLGADVRSGDYAAIKHPHFSLIPLA